MEGVGNESISENNDHFSKGPIVNNVLCYASTARHSMKTEDIIRICISFYKESDILKSKDLLCELLVKKSIRRRNEKRLVNEMHDIMDMLSKCDDEELSLPMFVVSTHDALPPSSGFEVVASHIVELIEEISNLRKEVQQLRESRRSEDIFYQDVGFIKEDVLTLKGEMRKLNHKLLGDELRRESLIIEKIENSPQMSKLNAEIRNGNSKGCNDTPVVCENVTTQNDSFAFLNDQVLPVLPTAPPLPSPAPPVEGGVSPSAPPASQGLLNWHREGETPSEVLCLNPTFADVVNASLNKENVRTDKVNLSVRN